MNTRKIEPGMLCMVVGTRNAGRECTAIRRVTEHEYVKEFERSGRGIPYVSRSGWLVHGPQITTFNHIQGEYLAQGYAVCTDSELLPIQPDNKLTMTEIKKIKVPDAPTVTV